MKSALLLAVCFFTCISLSSAQAREDRKNIVFTQKSGKLSKATGWMLNEDNGKWISHPNGVYEVSPISSRGSFIWMQAGSFLYEGQKLYALYYAKQSGSYVYPALRQDWRSYTTMGYSLMTAEQYAVLVKALDKSDGGIVQIDCVCDELIEASGEAQMCAAITNKLIESKGVIKPTNAMNISVQVVKGVKVVRFDQGYDMAGVINIGKAAPLSEGYFETDPASFKALLLPLSAEESAMGDKAIQDSDPVARKAKAKAEKEKERAKRLEMLMNGK